jgi:hypothetical protein
MRTSQVVPTHLRTPETLLSLAGIALSVRQFLLLFLGAALGYDGWLNLKILAELPGGVGLRLAGALVPFVCCAALAFVRIAGRTLDRWLLVLARYQTRSRRLVWRSVRFQEPGLVGAADEREEEGSHA